MSKKSPRPVVKKSPRPAYKKPAQLPRVPKTPEDAASRRLSLSPSSEHLLSPVDVLTAPIDREDLRESAVARILKWGIRMCRNAINDEYIYELARQQNVDLWTIKDAAGTIFGFAITERLVEYVKLYLICATKRKGEGIVLFKSILAWCRALRMDLSIDPINTDVAEKYVDAATSMDVLVEYRGRFIRKLPRHVFQDDEPILMWSGLNDSRVPP